MTDIKTAKIAVTPEQPIGDADLWSQAFDFTYPATELPASFWTGQGAGPHATVKDINYTIGRDGTLLSVHLITTVPGLDPERVEVWLDCYEYKIYCQLRGSEVAREEADIATCDDVTAYFETQMPDWYSSPKSTGVSVSPEERPWESAALPRLSVEHSQHGGIEMFFCEESSPALAFSAAEFIFVENFDGVTTWACDTCVGEEALTVVGPTLEAEIARRSGALTTADRAGRPEDMASHPIEEEDAWTHEGIHMYYCPDPQELHDKDAEGLVYEAVSLTLCRMASGQHVWLCPTCVEAPGVISVRVTYDTVV